MIEPELGSVGENAQGVSAGQTLRAEREAQQLSLEEISIRANIPVRHLISLENMELDKLPGLPFIKGYVRVYAKVLGLDNADELVASLSSKEPLQEPAVTSINKVGSEVRLSDPIMRISMILFVLAIIGTSIWWWQAQSGKELSGLSSLFGETPEVVAEPSTDSEPQVIDPTDIQSRLAAKREEVANIEQAFPELNHPSKPENQSPQSEVTASAEDEAEPTYLSAAEIERLASEMASESGAAESTDAEQALSSAQTPTDTAATDTAATENLQPADTKGLLELQFTGDCWVSIRDASGTLVFANTKHAGETLSMELSAPVSLLVGKVSAVQSARFMGEAVDLASVANKNVAQLTLPAGE